MSNFTSDDLAYAGYSQKINLSVLDILNEVDDKFHIDKADPFEVIKFCNQFLKKYRVSKTKRNFQKVEELLQHPFLENESNKEVLLDWIASNWVKII
jgi:hypothetical protein